MPETSEATSPTTSEPTRPYIGGQAVLEGVMMRSPTSFAVVVRRADGSLHVRERAMPDGRKGAAKLPLVRGIASLVESLKLGGEALRFSAEQMERDLDAAEKAASKAASSLLGVLRAIGYSLFLMMTADADTDGPRIESKSEDKGEGTEKKKSEGSKIPTTIMIVMMVGFLIALPQAAAWGVKHVFKMNVDVQSPTFQAMTGGFKLVIVIGYLLLVRRVFPDIRRVFQYHGAEHKTISTYEANEELNVTNARAKTTLHPRCGTTFLVMVALVSICVFTAVGSFLPKIDTGKEALNQVLFFLEKLPFVPVIAAVTFEIQRVFAKWCTTGPLRVLLWPGFLVQKITTIEPDDEQLEVALASLKVTLLREKGAADGAGNTNGDVRYANFDSLMKSPRLRRAA
jgi:uncharacterized protein YqhQ